MYIELTNYPAIRCISGAYVNHKMQEKEKVDMPFLWYEVRQRKGKHNNIKQLF